MRKALLLTITILCIAGIAAVSGCGTGSQGQKIALNELLQREGDSFTFEGSEGDLIVLSDAGTFRAVFDIDVIDGTYKILKSDDTSVFELVFKDQDGDTERIETWDIVEDEEGNPALIDSQGQEYILKGTGGSLRGE